MTLIGILLTIHLAQLPPTPAPAPVAPQDVLAAELSKLPKPVFDLFYALKNSLDYGIEKGRRPPKRLDQYRRVAPEFLAAFKREYRVSRYRVLGDDYELIVRRRSDRSERYRATRTEKFVWKAGRWESLGGYYYF